MRRLEVVNDEVPRGKAVGPDPVECQGQGGPQQPMHVNNVGVFA